MGKGQIETCCIKGCRHTRRICSLRSFPANPMQRERWFSGIRKNFDINFKYKRWYRLCDCHFDENCFIEKIGLKGQPVKSISKMGVPCKFPSLEALKNEPKVPKPKKTRPPPKKRNFAEEIDQKLAKMKAKAEATAVEEPALNFTLAPGMNQAWLTQLPHGKPYVIEPFALPATESSQSSSKVLCPPIKPKLTSTPSSQASDMTGVPVEQQSTMGYLIPVKSCGVTTTTEDLDENQVTVPLMIISSTPIPCPVVVQSGTTKIPVSRVSSSKKPGAAEDAVYLPVDDAEEMLEEFDEVDILPPLEELCRICAETIGEQMIEIFSEEGRAKNIPNLIMQYLPIEVLETDRLPLKVCSSCVNNLESCHQMNLKCKQADATLRRLLACVEEPDASPVPCVDNFYDSFLEEDSNKQDVEIDAEVSHSSHADEQGDLVINDVEDDADDKSILKCVYLDCNFQTPSTLKMLRHFPKFHKRFACLICWEDFETQNIRDKHKNEVHEGKHLCDLCGEALYSRQGLKKHMGTHLPTSEREFKCNICDAGYSAKNSLEKHMTRHRAERTLPCPVCNKMYFHKADVKKHLKTHVEKNTFKCRQCFKLFSCQRYLVTHVAKYHAEEFVYKCTLCEYSVNSLKVIVGHFQEHGIGTDTLLQHCQITSPFQCGSCNTYYSNRMTLRDHKIKYRGNCLDRDMAKTKKIHLCPDCGEPFLTLRLCNYHRRHFHGAIIPKI